MGKAVPESLGLFEEGSGSRREVRGEGSGLFGSLQELQDL